MYEKQVPIGSRYNAVRPNTILHRALQRQIQKIGLLTWNSQKTIHESSQMRTSYGRKDPIIVIWSWITNSLPKIPNTNSLTRILSRIYHTVPLSMLHKITRIYILYGDIPLCKPSSAMKLALVITIAVSFSALNILFPWYRLNKWYTNDMNVRCAE